MYKKKKKRKVFLYKLGCTRIDKQKYYYFHYDIWMNENSRSKRKKQKG